MRSVNFTATIIYILILMHANISHGVHGQLPQQGGA